MLTRLLSLIVFIGAYIAPAMSAESKDWLTLSGGTAYTLSLDDMGNLTARVPVRMADGAALSEGGVLRVRLHDVSGTLGRTKGLLEAMRPSLEDIPGNRGKSILISVEKGATAYRPGTFNVTLDVDEQKPKGTSHIQTIALTVQVPAPEVRAQPFSVHVVRQLDGSDSVIPSVLEFKELTSQAAARDLSISVLRDTVPPVLADSGKLVIKPSKITLHPGEATEVKVGVDGDFPMGETTGKLEARSPDLAAPLQVAFKVKVTRTIWWAVLATVAGVFVGWLVRVKLKMRLETAAALTAASKLIGDMDEELTRSADPDFAIEVQRIRKGLLDASDGAKPVDVDKATATAREELSKQRKALDDRLAPVASSMQELRELSAEAHRVPSNAAMASQRLGALFGVAEAALQARDAKAAAAALGAALQPLREEYKAALVEDIKQLHRYLSATVDAKPPIPALEQKALEQLVSDVDAARQEAPGGEASTAELRAVWRIWTRWDTRVRLVLAHLAEHASRLLAQAVGELGLPADDKEALALAERIQSTMGNAAIARDMATHPYSASGFETRVLELRQAWVDLLLSKAPALDAKNARQLADQGQWDQLLQSARDVLHRAHGGAVAKGASDAFIVRMARLSSAEAELLGRVPYGLEVARGLQDIGYGAGAGGPPWISRDFGDATSRLPTLSELTGKEEERNQLRLHSASTEALQSVVLAVVLIGGVVALYSDTWVGNLKEVLAIFVLAFGVDLSSEGILTALKKT
ncbi:hypothetical protein [Hydrogenophaga luteola]|uniref:Uncharacterized protein n=1 Tax=Hydrogenophaga luteola TaxID=1591122 RepID=A0ABV7W9R1_9BURK